jgi:hypothetical protein
MSTSKISRQNNEQFFIPKFPVNTTNKVLPNETFERLHLSSITREALVGLCLHSASFGRHILPPLKIATLPILQTQQKENIISSPRSKRAVRHFELRLRPPTPASLKVVATITRFDHLLSEMAFLPPVYIELIQ